MVCGCEGTCKNDLKERGGDRDCQIYKGKRLDDATHNTGIVTGVTFGKKKRLLGTTIEGGKVKGDHQDGQETEIEVEKPVKSGVFGGKRRRKTLQGGIRTEVA